MEGEHNSQKDGDIFKKMIGATIVNIDLIRSGSRYYLLQTFKNQDDETFEVKIYFTSYFGKHVIEDKEEEEDEINKTEYGGKINLYNVHTQEKINLKEQQIIQDLFR